MLKVCHIISGDLWAGAEVMALHLLKGLKKYPDLEQSAILFNRSRLADEIRCLGISLDIVEENRLSFFQILSAGKKILRDRQPDLIHSHNYKENILSYLASKVLKDIKLVGTQHGLPERYRGKKALKNQFVSKINFLLLSRCFQKVVVVCSDIQSAFVRQYGIKRDKLRLIHNGIEPPEAFPRCGNKNRVAVGSSGRLFPVKDYPLMVEIARVINEKTDKIRFELAGEGPERITITDLIKAYNLNGSFVLMGHVDDISSFYQGLDLYLSTSIHEGIPLSVLEAMAHGLPVVAPKVGGIREIVDDGVQGYLIDDRDPTAFAEKLLLLCENSELRQRMSAAARERVVRDFSMEHMAQQYYHLYLDITKNS